ncbi:MAG: MOSC domain-containing protein [Candidatus Hydrogenedentota bacterium]
MKLLSLNISDLLQVEHRGKTVGAGIFKRSVNGPVRATRLTLEGDRRVDLRYHGGEHKAIYLYPHEHYAHWREVLGKDDLPMGRFGENFTTKGLLETDVHIGDRFRVGKAEIEITQLRVPCFKLGIAVGDPRFVKTFLQSERSGFYARVLQEGDVQAGDTLERTHSDSEGVTAQYIHHLYFRDSSNKPEIERVLTIDALSKEWRKQFREL